jgi:hypothetical protein
MTTDNSPSLRRLAENELIFEGKNKSKQAWFETYKKKAAEAGVISIQDLENMPLPLYCECSNLSCTARIFVTTKDYEQIHKTGDQFIIACGHDNPDIETVISESEDYCVVKKHVMPLR